jgi:hypothetical protein
MWCFAAGQVSWISGVLRVCVRLFCHSNQRVWWLVLYSTHTVLYRTKSCCPFCPCGCGGSSLLCICPPEGWAVPPLPATPSPPPLLFHPPLGFQGAASRACVRAVCARMRTGRVSVGVAESPWHSTPSVFHVTLFWGSFFFRSFGRGLSGAVLLPLGVGRSFPEYSCRCFRPLLVPRSL